MTDGTGCSIAIVGGGPAGLMAAETLAAGGASVTVYDRMPSLAPQVSARRARRAQSHAQRGLGASARPLWRAEPRLRAAIEAFPPAALRAWCEGLGQETFIGSSGRVFPTAMKASPLLRAWLRRLAQRGRRFKPAPPLDRLG